MSIAGNDYHGTNPGDDLQAMLHRTTCGDLRPVRTIVRGLRIKLDTCHTRFLTLQPAMVAESGLGYRGVSNVAGFCRGVTIRLSGDLPAGMF